MICGAALTCQLSCQKDKRELTDTQEQSGPRGMCEVSLPGEEWEQWACAVGVGVGCFTAPPRGGEGVCVGAEACRLCVFRGLLPRGVLFLVHQYDGQLTLVGQVLGQALLMHRLYVILTRSMSMVTCSSHTSKSHNFCSSKAYPRRVPAKDLWRLCTFLQVGGQDRTS